MQAAPDPLQLCKCKLIPDLFICALVKTTYPQVLAFSLTPQLKVISQGELTDKFN